MNSCNTIPSLQMIRSKAQKLNAVFWDMDGTILNTEILHVIAVHKVLKSQGEDMSHQELDAICMGQVEKVVLEKLKAKGLLKMMSYEQFLREKNTYMETLIFDANEVSEDGTVLFDSQVKSLIDEIHKAQVPQAVVTSSDRVTAHSLLKKYGVHHYFTQIITREDTQNNKPSADPYIHASNLLGVDIKESAIFEDSEVGLAAANKTNATVFKACWY